MCAYLKPVGPPNGWFEAIFEFLELVEWKFVYPMLVPVPVCQLSTLGISYQSILVNILRYWFVCIQCCVYHALTVSLPRPVKPGMVRPIFDLTRSIDLWPVSYSSCFEAHLLCYLDDKSTGRVANSECSAVKWIMLYRLSSHFCEQAWWERVRHCPWVFKSSWVCELYTLIL